jgi:hypothetical protein
MTAARAGRLPNPNPPSDNIFMVAHRLTPVDPRHYMGLETENSYSSGNQEQELIGIQLLV